MTKAPDLLEIAKMLGKAEAEQQQAKQSLKEAVKLRNDPTAYNQLSEKGKKRLPGLQTKRRQHFEQAKAQVEMVKSMMLLCQQRLEDKAAHSGTGYEFARRRLPRVPELPKFTAGANTSERDVRDYFHTLSNKFKAAGFADTDEDLQVAQLPTIFATPARRQDVKIAENLVTEGATWEQAIAKFVDAFARDHDPLKQAHDLEGLKQGSMSVKAFARIFRDAVERHFLQPVDNWETTIPTFIAMFVRQLRPALMQQLAYNETFVKAAQKGLEPVINLAARVEESLVAGDRTVARNSKKSKGAGRDSNKNDMRGGSGGGSPADQQKKERIECTRCGRKHLGGAQACVATTHRNGGPLSPDPRAKRERAEQLAPGSAKKLKAEKRCFKCGHTGHVAYQCPDLDRVQEVNFVGGSSSGLHAQFQDPMPALSPGSATDAQQQQQRS
jgi:hypothetical protein